MMQDRVEFLDRRIGFLALRTLQLRISEYVLLAFEGDGVISEELPLATEVRDLLEQELLLIRARAIAWGLEKHARDTLVFALRESVPAASAAPVVNYYSVENLKHLRSKLEELSLGQLADALSTLGLSKSGSLLEKRDRLRSCLEWVLDDKQDEQLPLALEEFKRTHEKKRGRPKLK
jgi:hypothetical protein